MKIFLTICLAISAAFASAQGMMDPLPKELGSTSFWLGTWKGEMTYYFGGSESKGNDLQVSKMTMGGRYFESTHKYMMGPEMPAMEGLHLITFNDLSKKWEGYWFDGASAHALQMEGAVSDTEITMITKPVTGPGSEMAPTIRSTMKRIDAKSYSFSLDMKMGDQWAPLMKGTYKKQ